MVGGASYDASDYLLKLILRILSLLPIGKPVFRTFKSNREQIAVLINDRLGSMRS
jgi:hypothetical protein